MATVPVQPGQQSTYGSPASRTPHLSLETTIPQPPEKSAKIENAALAVVAGSATPAIPAPAAVEASASPATASPSKRKIRVLYLLAGQPGQWDMRDCLTKLGYEQGVDIDIHCVDIQRKPRIDLSKTKEREKLLQAIRAGAYDAILLSPSRELRDTDVSWATSSQISFGKC